MALSRTEWIAIQETVADREGRLAAARRFLAGLRETSPDAWLERAAAVRDAFAILAHYDRLADRMDQEPWFVFMNHGYVPREDERMQLRALATEDQPWRHQVWLYLHLLNSAAAVGRWPARPAGPDLLDVGCGRGGGLSAARRYFSLGRAAGLDFHPRHVAFCRSRHGGLDLEFTEGNALAMPYDNASFDLVINVESSHCYPDIAAFLREVRRVLRPHGLLLLTDIRSNAASQRLDAAIAASGMTQWAARDITDRVRLACECDEARPSPAFPGPQGDVPQKVAARAARAYAKGTQRYLSFVLEA